MGNEDGSLQPVQRQVDTFSEVLKELPEDGDEGPGRHNDHFKRKDRPGPKENGFPKKREGGDVHKPTFIFTFTCFW